MRKTTGRECRFTPSSRAGALLVAAFWLALAGCGASGPELAPLTGLVTLDGKPLAGAALMFVPVAGGRPAQAVTDAAGHFTAWTLQPNDGALVGEHQVAVSLVEITGLEASPDGLEGAAPGPISKISKIPLRYGDVATSALKTQVEAVQDNVAQFALTANE